MEVVEIVNIPIITLSVKSEPKRRGFYVQIADCKPQAGLILQSVLEGLAGNHPLKRASIERRSCETLIGL